MDATRVDRVASDGTTLYVSVETPTGGVELQALPVAGGDMTTIAISSEPFALTAFGDAVFYSQRAGALYELHQRSGATDVVLGTIDRGPVELAANATDVFALVPGTTLRRFPRAGGEAEVVTTIAGTGRHLALGTTVAAFTVGTEIMVAPISAPSTATSAGAGRGPLALVGDRGFHASVQRMTSNTVELTVRQFTPVDDELISHILHGEMIGLYADGTSLYWSYRFPLSPDDNATYAVHDLDLGTGVRTCAYAGEPRAHDATHLYGVDDGNGRLSIIAVPRPIL